MVSHTISHMMELDKKEGLESTEVLVEDCKKWPQYLAASLGMSLYVCVQMLLFGFEPHFPTLGGDSMAH